MLKHTNVLPRSGTDRSHRNGDAAQTLTVSTFRSQKLMTIPCSLFALSELFSTFSTRNSAPNNADVKWAFSKRFHYKIFYTHFLSHSNEPGAQPITPPPRFPLFYQNQAGRQLRNVKFFSSFSLLPYYPPPHVTIYYH
jgi:hypothetical protein